MAGLEIFNDTAGDLVLVAVNDLIGPEVLVESYLRHSMFVPVVEWVVNSLVGILVLLFGSASANPSDPKASILGQSPTNIVRPQVNPALLEGGLRSRRVVTINNPDVAHRPLSYYFIRSTGTLRPILQESTLTTRTVMSDGTTRHTETIAAAPSWHRAELWRDYGRLAVTASGTIIGAAVGSGFFQDIWARSKRGGAAEPTVLHPSAGLHPPRVNNWLSSRATYLSGRSGAIITGAFYGSLVGSWAWGEYMANFDSINRIRESKKW